MRIKKLIAAAVFSLLIWSPALAELPTLDEPPNYGHTVWIEQLQSLPDLEPGEQVFALLDLTHFSPDDTRQYVVEIRKSQARISVYSGFPGKPLVERTLNEGEVSWFLSDLEWQHADELPHLFDPGVSDLNDAGFYHWTADGGHSLLMTAGFGEGRDYRASRGRQDTAPYERLRRTFELLGHL